MRRDACVPPPRKLRRMISLDPPDFQGSTRSLLAQGQLDFVGPLPRTLDLIEGTADPLPTPPWAIKDLPVEKTVVLDVFSKFEP